MESRVINAIDLRKTQPLALRQLRVSVICARLWSQFLLDNDELPKEQRVRAVLNDRRFRDVFLDHGIDAFAAVLVDHPLLPERFREQRYPQMQVQLVDRLKRDRRNRQRRAKAASMRTS